MRFRLYRGRFLFLRTLSRSRVLLICSLAVCFRRQCHAQSSIDPQPLLGSDEDIGVLRGANFQTTQRGYWSNKATATNADVPSEAELTPCPGAKWRME
jgi:hypothetical protein